MCVLLCKNTSSNVFIYIITHFIQTLFVFTYINNSSPGIFTNLLAGNVSFVLKCFHSQRVHLWILRCSIFKPENDHIDRRFFIQVLRYPLFLFLFSLRRHVNDGMNLAVSSAATNSQHHMTRSCQRAPFKWGLCLGCVLFICLKMLISKRIQAGYSFNLPVVGRHVQLFAQVNVTKIYKNKNHLSPKQSPQTPYCRHHIGQINLGVLVSLGKIWMIN